MMNRRIGLGAVLIALTMAVALLSGCAETPVVHLDAGSTAKDRTLTVQGTGSVVVDPDIARITVGVMTSDADAATAQDENDAVMAGVISAVQEAGVEEKDIQTTQYSAYPRYNYDSNINEIVGFEVTHMIRVTIRDIDSVGQVLKAANRAGANQSYDISFDVEDRDAAYQEALKEAIENAKEKAQAMASPAGITLGEPAAVYEGGTASTYGDDSRAYALADYGLGGVPAQSGQLEVSASVTIVYSIVQNISEA